MWYQWKQGYFFVNSASYISFQGFTLNIIMTKDECYRQYTKLMLKENGYKAPKSVSTEDSIMANIQWTGYSSNRLQNVYRMSIECLQNVYRGMLSSPQIRLKHFQRMMFPPIHQLRHTLCLFYQNMIQRIDGQKADLYITLTLCNKDFI